jgi:hypothetical protein
MPPLALTTRYQGTPAGHPFIARPTARAERGEPIKVATWPYVTTRPVGTDRTSR